MSTKIAGRTKCSLLSWPAAAAIAEENGTSATELAGVTIPVRTTATVWVLTESCIAPIATAILADRARVGKRYFVRALQLVEQLLGQLLLLSKLRSHKAREPLFISKLVPKLAEGGLGSGVKLKLKKSSID